MGLRGQRAVTLSSGQAVRFLVALIGGSSIAFPAQWVHGIVMPASAGSDGLVTWAGMDYERTDLSVRLKIVSKGSSPDTRLILYGNEERSRSFAVDKVLGLLDVERALIHPLPPQFRGKERERLLGFFVDTSSVALIANPFWVLELPLRPHALEMFAIRFAERKPGESDSRLHVPVATVDETVSMSTSPVS
ncbi:MAG: CheW-like domain-containing protein [Nitrospira sp.]|nr:hypothetical protein [Nitrospira sp.]ULA58133.1 MAG: CheW-like domain-containing protein [Nitrospira sp.]